MSILSSVESGLSKGIHFILSVFTKTSAVLAVLAKVSPQTLAAMLAVFYDFMNFVAEGGSVATLFETGQTTVAINTIISPTTQTLLAQLEADIKAGEKVIVDDLTELGVALKTPTPAA